MQRKDALLYQVKYKRCRLAKATILMSDIRQKFEIIFKELKSFGEPYVFEKVDEKFWETIQKLESLSPCCSNPYVNKGFLPLQNFVLKPPERILSLLTLLLYRYEGYEKSDDGNDPNYSSESDENDDTSPESPWGGTAVESVFDITDPQNAITWQHLTQDDNPKSAVYDRDSDNDDKSQDSGPTNMSLEWSATEMPDEFSVSDEYKIKLTECQSLFISIQARLGQAEERRVNQERDRLLGNPEAHMSCDSEQENSSELGLDDSDSQEMEEADDHVVDTNEIVDVYAGLRDEFGQDIFERALEGLDKHSFEMLQGLGIVENLPTSYKESEDYSMELIRRFNERCLHFSAPHLRYCSKGGGDGR